MRKFTSFLFVLFISFTAVFAQSDYNKQSLNSNTAKADKGVHGCWDLKVDFDLYSTASQAGIEYDGHNFYTAVWNSTPILKYDSAGNYLSTFSIPGVTGLRDLAFDGTYFYGGNTLNSTIYKMDFNSHTLVSTISCPSSVVVRHIAYDPINNAFWCGDWNTNIYLVSMTGTILSTIPSVTSTLPSIYGSAFDTVTPGGPYLWVFSQGSTGDRCDIGQINVATGQPTGLIYDIYFDLDIPGGSMAGGLFTQYDANNSEWLLGGLAQGDKIFTYDLASTIPKTYDGAVNAFDINYFSSVSSNINITGVLQNAGMTPITSLDLSYSVNNGTAVTQSLTSLNIPAFGTYNFTHGTPWSSSVPGFYNFKVWVGNINSNADQASCNDTMKSFTLVMPASASQRLVLHEAFTSATCTPCVAGNQNLKSVFDANANKWTCIKYQMNWPGSGDIYYNNDGAIRKDYYGVNAVPHLMVDGQWDDNTSNYTTAILNSFYSKGSPLDISATHSVGGTTVHVDVDLDPIMDYPAGMMLYVAVVENETYNNAGSNGETVFYFVEQKMLPDGNGTILPALTANNTHTESFTANLAGSHVEDYTNLSVVVFLQHDPYKIIHNSAWSVEVSGIDDYDNSGNGIAGLFPNPASTTTVLNYVIKNSQDVNLEVFDILGELVYSKEMGKHDTGYYTTEIDVSDLSSGLYMLNLQIGKKVYNKKLHVK